MSVVSKNLFDVLGDGDEPGAGAPAAKDKSTRGKPEAARGNVGGGRRGASANEAAYRDRNVGSDRNRSKPTEEGNRGGPRGGAGARVRGGRGGRRPRENDDRHNKGAAHGGSEKTASHAWGAAEGEAELKDEEAGEKIAKAEAKEGEEGAAEEGAAAADSQEKHKTLDEYMAEQAEKKMALDAHIEVRKANEGSKLDKKWANAKPLKKDEDEEFMIGTGGKQKRERVRQQTKQVVEIDQRYHEPERTRGGRGGGRGGSGGRGRGGERGRGRGGGGGGGGHHGGHGGHGRGADSSPLNPDDKSAFPSLGSK